ncbi:hypothetical protein OC846_001476, partial [Tilletia horrida]
MPPSTSSSSTQMRALWEYHSRKLAETKLDELREAMEDLIAASRPRKRAASNKKLPKHLKIGDVVFSLEEVDTIQKTIGRLLEEADGYHAHINNSSNNSSNNDDDESDEEDAVEEMV